ncbi:N-acyl-D-amino-acid deacylase family protein [Achromobacter arsenitoxydans]|uniref:N-acyl-D-aspartate deacylase n=1 Tax=Achromobacter arsenitoxydans SY8 TaxID=477184 RepID=H0FBC4_9BURK|nr:D-aminoacylase [Achromobacter arsenitoxydans]EHK64389.1 N-acyl-D-aspartate deacylase [Achromobacter arsenitoxydans SY8]
MTADTLQADFIVAGATLIDGSGGPARQGDLAVRDGRIAAVGDFAHPAGVPVIDGRGQALAPGFIDSHTHDDGYLLAHPDMLPKVSQGITTVVTGNCGISLAPLARTQIPQPLDLLGPAELFRFGTFRAWMDALRATPAAVNVIPLVGHTTLRVAVMDDTSRAASEPERAAMRGLMQEALDAGAFGVSTGTFYPPASAAPTDEIIDVCRPLRGRAGIYATHLRDEADHIVPAMEEALLIGRELDCRVVFSHHKLAGERNHGRTRETLDIISRAAASQPVCLDCHPYPATSTMLRLDRARLASRTMITWSKGYPEATGRDFSEVMAELGLDDEAAVARLAPAGAIYFLMDTADVNRIFAHPLTMVGSDGLPFDPHPHPRQWGTFTNVLRTMVREQNLLTLESAIHKMTGLAAAQYGVAGRGLLQEGYHADLVLFDPATVTDAATFSAPIQASQGIHAVWVNGRQVWDGERTGAERPGQVLTPGDA